MVRVVLSKNDYIEIASKIPVNKLEERYDMLFGDEIRKVTEHISMLYDEIQSIRSDIRRIKGDAR